MGTIYPDLKVLDPHSGASATIHLAYIPIIDFFYTISHINHDACNLKNTSITGTSNDVVGLRVLVAGLLLRINLLHVEILSFTIYPYSGSLTSVP